MAEEGKSGRDGHFGKLLVPHFAVDAIEEALKGLGVDLMEDGLKVEGDYSGSSDDVDAWGERILAAL